MKNACIILIFFVSLLSCDSSPKISTNPKGIGPIDTLVLETINDSLMNRGKKLFETKCTQCHTMEFKNVGPEISDLLAYREPEWVVNFLINKDKMLAKDSLAMYTRSKYEADCGAEITSKDEAKEILEYFRIYQIWLHEFNVK